MGTQYVYLSSFLLCLSQIKKKRKKSFTVWKVYVSNKAHTSFERWERPNSHLFFFSFLLLLPFSGDWWIHTCQSFASHGVQKGTECAQSWPVERSHVPRGACHATNLQLEVCAHTRESQRYEEWLTHCVFQGSPRLIGQYFCHLLLFVIDRNICISKQVKVIPKCIILLTGGGACNYSRRHIRDWN